MTYSESGVDIEKEENIMKKIEMVHKLKEKSSIIKRDVTERFNLKKIINIYEWLEHFQLCKPN